MGNYVVRALIDNYYPKPVKTNNKNKKNTFLATFKENKVFDHKTGQLYLENKSLVKEKPD